MLNSMIGIGKGGVSITKRKSTVFSTMLFSPYIHTNSYHIGLVKFVLQLAVLRKIKNSVCTYYHLLIYYYTNFVSNVKQMFLYLLPLYFGAYVNIGFVDIVVCNRKWLILYRNLKFTFISRYSHLWYYVTLFLLGVSVDCVYEY